MQKRKKIAVNAVLDTDIEKVLKHTNQFEALIQGEILCKSCKVIITAENIGIIVPTKKDQNIHLEFYCERLDCIDEYHKGNGKA